MRKLLVVLAFLALSGTARAQHILIGTGDCPVGTDPCYEPSLGAESEAIAQAWLRNVHNANVCASVGLAENCTQADFNNAGGIPGCTPGESMECTVYGTNGAGLKAFFLDRIKQRLAEDRLAYMSAYRALAKAAWDGALTAERTAACAELPGCTTP